VRQHRDLMIKDALCPAGRAAGFGRAPRARGQGRSKSATAVHSSVAIPRRGAARMPSQRSAILDRAARQARPKLPSRKAGGDKGLVGTAVFRRYLKTVLGRAPSPSTRSGSPKTRALTGLYVLRTNTKLTRFRSSCAIATYLAGRAVVPPGQGRACQLANLPQQRHGDRGHCSAPSLPCCSVGTRGSPPPQTTSQRMGRHLRDLDRLQEIELEQEWQALPAAHPTTGVAG